ncbi:MAG TPA: 2Fe-2S iron-sulfur cluster-binding protein [Streptosporangiaceae bacterium]|nr:2Fe-2S iron-sulfur cluster-binding protein [Streptosporangiaceae bacterium]
MQVNNIRQVDESSLPVGLRLLELLREHLGLTGTKEACGRGECGACTVLVDGRPVLACITLAHRVSGQVETVEGIAGEAADLRESFADHAAFQCGFCTPGQLVRAVSLLRHGVPPDDRQVREAMSGNICRCTGYQGIIKAIQETARARAARSTAHPATATVPWPEGSGR